MTLTLTLYERVNKYLYKICTMNYVTSTFLRINFVLLQMNFYMATFVRFVFGLQESALTKMCTDFMHFLYTLTTIYVLCIAHISSIIIDDMLSWL